MCLRVRLKGFSTRIEFPDVLFKKQDCTLTKFGASAINYESTWKIKNQTGKFLQVSCINRIETGFLSKNNNSIIERDKASLS